MKDRKKSHIDLAFNAQTFIQEIDERFSYEPLLHEHPQRQSLESTFLGKQFKVPLWVSSMTGGTSLARIINTNLAKACKHFGMGMGLGSCRHLLEDDTWLQDFDMRDIIGDENAFYANLGISQLEQYVLSGKVQRIHDLVSRLRTDGLIIHVNPLQEWFQPEGDRLSLKPIETIKRFLEKVTYKVIVKEVGQGMGKSSLQELMKLPLEAIEFAAFGGTNFAKVELLRNPDASQELYEPLVHVGVSAQQMLHFTNEIFDNRENIKCNQLIISGGVKNYLDGYYLMNKSKFTAIYGNASAYLKYARESYDELHAYIEGQIEGLMMAKTFLTVK